MRNQQKEIWEKLKYLEINMLLHNPRVKQKITREILKYFELNKNENKTCHNLWDTTIGVVRNPKSSDFKEFYTKNERRKGPITKDT